MVMGGLEKARSAAAFFGGTGVVAQVGKKNA